MSYSIDDIDDHWTAVDCATLLFVCLDNRVLLIRKKRGLGAGKINGPGGKLEPGESPVACAVREVEEELGISPLAPQARGRLRFQFIDGYSINFILSYSNVEIFSTIRPYENVIVLAS